MIIITLNINFDTLVIITFYDYYCCIINYNLQLTNLIKNSNSYYKSRCIK